MKNLEIGRWYGYDFYHFSRQIIVFKIDEDYDSYNYYNPKHRFKIDVSENIILDIYSGEKAKFSVNSIFHKECYPLDNIQFLEDIGVIPKVAREVQVIDIRDIKHCLVDKSKPEFYKDFKLLLCSTFGSDFIMKNYLEEVFKTDQENYFNKSNYIILERFSKDNFTISLDNNPRMPYSEKKIISGKKFFNGEIGFYINNEYKKFNVDQIKFKDEDFLF